jgi:hypothetical protein
MVGGGVASNAVTVTMWKGRLIVKVYKVIQNWQTKKYTVESAEAEKTAKSYRFPDYNNPWWHKVIAKDEAFLTPKAALVDQYERLMQKRESLRLRMIEIDDGLNQIASLMSIAGDNDAF